MQTIRNILNKFFSHISCKVSCTGNTFTHTQVTRNGPLDGQVTLAAWAWLRAASRAKERGTLAFAGGRGWRKE